LEYSIWEQAWRFTSAAVIFAIIGLLALVFGVIAEIGGNSSGICWIVMAATLTTAFWLYLIAQILHIRALLTKK
jgi:ABC-type multidrug transport system permease subunit